MINIALCDDNKTSLKIISDSVTGIFAMNHIEAKTTLYTNAKEFFESAGKSVYDLILLDIELPGMDGIDIGKILRKNGNDTDIIFISAREDRMYDAFQVHPFGFIRKSSYLKDVEKVLGAYIEKYRSEKDVHSIMFKAVGKGPVAVPIKKIEYIEGQLKNQHVYIDGTKEPVTINSTMKNLEETLTPHGFIRIHSGYLINFAFLKFIGKDEVTLTSGAILPVSRRNVGELKTAYMNYIKLQGGITY